MNNKSKIVIFILFLVSLIIILLKNKAVNEDLKANKKIVETVNPTKSGVRPTISSNLQKKDVKSPPIKMEEPSSGNLDKTLDLVLMDIEKCENSMNELFGPEENEIDLNHFTDHEVLELITKFGDVQFTGENSNSLMNLLANENIDLNEQASKKIQNIRPCRLFQKINFLDSVKNRIKNTKSNDFRDSAFSQLQLYFKNEVLKSNSISNLTMVLNILEGFYGEVDFKSNKKRIKIVEGIIEELENDYESILNSAETELGENEENQKDDLVVSQSLIKKEIELNNIYKNKILQVFESSNE